MHIIRATISAVFIWSATVSVAGAVNIYDVIELSRQGYDDEQIVDIVNVTHSVFKLTAADIPRLKKLGVSEVVIRVMLGSGPVDLSRAESFPRVGVDRESTISSDIARLNDDDAEFESPQSAKGSARIDRAARFSLQTVLEEAAGDQEHLYVTILGAPVLILGDEGQFRSVEDRGKAIVRNLQEAARMGDGGFRLLRSDDTVQVVYHSADLRELPVITLNSRDIHAYDVRSERRVTANVLASYWAALLNDYWAMSVQGRSPSRLVNLHRGGALKLLFESVNANDTRQSGNQESAVEQLPAEIQGHLERLATAVPDDFSPFPG
ncbi:MAG: hypothetical protein GXP15_12485 [Gammaproteobacteria bacterium]|nr:hypothetical protein [Gammaproteobacteria bacterium]